MIRSAPFSFFVFLAVGVTAGFLASNWYYSKQIAENNGQINRYQVALGIKPGSPGALVELTNQELAVKTQSIVANLREYTFDLNAKVDDINKRRNAGQIDDAEKVKEITEATKDISLKFDNNLASDAFNVENELRKRLSPQALAHVVRVPAFIVNNDPSSRVTFMYMMRGSPFDSLMIASLANEMEEMAKLLPGSAN